MINNFLRSILKKESFIIFSRRQGYLIILGLFLAIVSMFSSLRLSFPYWYTPFLIGVILVLAVINQRLSKHSFLGVMLEFLKDYPLFLIACLFLSLYIFLWIDYFWGQVIFSFWQYPYLSGFWRIIVPVVLYYPLGVLSVVESFLFFDFLLTGRHKDLVRVTELQILKKKKGITLFC